MDLGLGRCFLRYRHIRILWAGDPLRHRRRQDSILLEVLLKVFQIAGQNGIARQSAQAKREKNARLRRVSDAQGFLARVSSALYKLPRFFQAQKPIDERVRRVDNRRHAYGY